MLRPLPPHPSIEPDVVDDDAAETSVLSRREYAAAAFGGLADVLEPVVPSPVSVRAPVQVQDFAFADTVIARDLPADEPTPPSSPIFVNDVAGSTQCVTPLAFPLPTATQDASVGTHVRVFSAQVRHAIRYSLDEMRELWATTAEIVDGDAAGAGDTDGYAPPQPPARGAERFLRRVLALWSCWQWDRADFTRAALIGLGVFVVTAVIGAVGATSRAAGTGDSSASEVRATHTLDQHTGRNIATRTKAVAR